MTGQIVRYVRDGVAAVVLGVAVGVSLGAEPTTQPAVRIVRVARGWARNTVNGVIIRRDPIATFGDTQYVAFYDEDGHVVLARRRLGADAWEIERTRYTGNTRDAHNAICIAVDGEGRLHMAWDHHVHPLRYVTSTEPGSLTLTEKKEMTGQDEQRVTYPEFFNLPDGDLLCMYRDGQAGNGDTLLNRYDVQTHAWHVVQHPLIVGEGKRNAYTNQIAIGRDGVWHLSWCWREPGGVQTNHDICYARSADEGRTWTRSDGTAYALPITEAQAEIVQHIVPESELINHCTSAVDAAGRPVIATYWRSAGETAPQYHVLFYDGSRWQVRQVGEHHAPWDLAGGGTRRLPMSRPCVLAMADGGLVMLFRDVERDDRISAAISRDADYRRWSFVDLTTAAVGQWEPTVDHALWQAKGVLGIFMQRVGQLDEDRLEDLPPQMVSVLEWQP